MSYINKNGYMKLRNYKNSFQEKEHVKSILVYEGEKSNIGVDITFVIPTYKRVDTLIETVESVLMQKKSKLRYSILILDNSSDFSNNNQIRKYIINLNSPYIKYYINQENLGMIGNWNRCFVLSKSKYVAMLHDDDLVANDYLSEMEKYLAIVGNDKLGIIRASWIDFTDVHSLPKLDRSIKTSLKSITMFESLLIGIGPTSCPSCGMLFNRNAFMQTGGFRSEYYPSADYIVGYQILQNGYKVYETSQKLSYYRVGINESTDRNINLLFCKCDYYFREYMYTENFIYRIFGFIFKKYQYSESVNGLVKNAKRFGNYIEIREMAFTKGYGNYPLRRFLFKSISKINQLVQKKINVS